MYLLSKRIMLYCCFLMAAGQVIAQSPSNVNVTLVVQPSYSPHISDYTSQTGKIVATLLNTSPASGSVQVYLLGSISSSGGINIYTDPTYKMPEPITLLPGQPYMIRMNTLQQVFSDHLVYEGISKQEVINGNGLPEDEYQICLRAYDYNTGQPVSDEEPQGCTSINITNVEPPVILNPICGDSITASQPQSIIMSWTMPPGTPMNTQYYIKIVEIMPGDRDPNDAMNTAGHPLFFESTQLSTSFIYGPAEPALVEGKNYAFSVTAVDPTGKTAYRNGGSSEVCSFIYRPTQSITNPMTPSGSNQGAPTSNNSVPPSGNNPGTPISNNSVPPLGNNPNNNQNNNPSPNANIDFSQLTGDLNCSCNITAPTGQIDTTDLKKYSKVKVGKFEMTIVNIIITPDGKSSGEGKMPIPFLNLSQANIRVLFSDMTVTRTNGVNVMMTGIVKAKRTNNINLSPDVDNPTSGVNPFTKDDVKALDTYLSTNTDKLISNIKNASVDFEMPLGIDKDIDGKKLTIALVDFTFTPEQAGFSACMAYSIPEDNTIISVGAKNICLDGASSFCGDMFLFLTNDLNVSSLNLTFKAISKSDSGTYVSFTKDGFRKLRVRADYEFSQKLIVRQSDKQPVIATLVADVVDWNDWMATLKIDPFALADNDDFKFDLKGVATYDHSDIRNPVGIPTSKIEEKDNFLNNAWYGFLMPELDITLPPVFKNAKTAGPISVKVLNMMIDNMGLTGDAKGTKVLNIDDGDLDGWAYSMDSVGLRFVNNSYINGGLSGKILLPITTKTEHSQLDYHCLLTHKDNDPKKPLVFDFVIKPKNKLDIPVFIALVDIENTSSIEVKYDTKFSAVAKLNGKMDITTPKSGEVPEIKLLDMKFQDMVLQSQPDYFSVKKFTMSLNSPPKEASGFPISFDSAQMITTGGIGIKFWVKFTLADIPAMPKASAVFTITGSPVKVVNGKLAFDFNPVLKLDSLGIEGDMAVLTVKGYVKFYSGQVKYGDGFKGAIEAWFPSLDVGIKSALQIGTVNNMNYWYVDAMADFGETGIPLFPGTAAYGFGGGAYYNMKSNYAVNKTLDVKQTKEAKVDIGKSPSDVVYEPSQGDMGIKATLLFGLQKRETFNADVTMELGFNGDFGISYFKLVGRGRVLGKDSTKSMGIGEVKVEYQFGPKIFDLNANVSLKLGVATANGTLALHAEPAGFYLKVGQPDPVGNRVQILLGKPGLQLSANFYFEAGTMDIDPIPPIPTEIQQILNKSNVPINTGFLASARNALPKDGSGLILGGGLKFEFNKCLGIFCGKLYAGVGFDVSIEHYSTDCDGNSNTGSTIGIDGWYAIGQAYAGVQATIYIDLGVTNATIFDAGAGAVLMAKLPNPEYFAGVVGGYYDIGIASGNFSYDFETGTSCNLGNDPIKQLKLISDIDPHPDQVNDKVEINVIPQIGTNIEIGKYFTLTDYDGNKTRDRYFRFTKDNIDVKYTRGGIPVAFTKMVSDDNKNMIMFPDSFLLCKTDYVLEITATLDEYIDQKWDIAKNKDKTPFLEHYIVKFKTGNGIDHLTTADVTYTMPYYGERNFCYANVAQGLIRCKLTPTFGIFNTPHKDESEYYNTTYLVRFVPTGSSPSSAKITESAVTISENDFQFDIPTDLLKETIYTVQFIARWKSKNQGTTISKPAVTPNVNNAYTSSIIHESGNLLFENKRINERRLTLKQYEQQLFIFSFRTSKFTDYVDKMKALAVMAGDFNAKGQNDKTTRLVSAGQKELTSSDKLKDLLSGTWMRHGDLVNAYPASFCVYGEEQFDVFDVSDQDIRIDYKGIKYNAPMHVPALLNFKTACFEQWAKSIYDDLSATVKAGGVTAEPYNSKYSIYISYYPSAMPPLTENEAMTGVNTTTASEPVMQCGSVSNNPMAYQSSFLGFSDNTVSIIQKSVKHVSSGGAFLMAGPSSRPSTELQLLPDAVAENWHTTKDLTLNVAFGYGPMVNLDGNYNNNVVATNTMMASLYGSNLSGGGNKLASFAKFYQGVGNTFDKVKDIQPAFTKDPCFTTNFKGIKRAGAQNRNESMNISYGK